MSQNRSGVIKELISFVRESSAIIHYFSDFVIAISIYNIIFEQGEVVLVIVWIAIALISASIAELLKSKLPTPLRIVFRRKSIV
jgi:hypothetical protein